MSTVPTSPFVLVGDPAAASCEGDVCAVPAVREQASTEDQEPDLSPAEDAPAPPAGS